MGKTEWQWHYVKHDYVESATNSSTIREKLPVREQISCIEVEFRAEKSAVNYDYGVIDMLEKIEVIANGSTVLYSCIPEVAAFLHLCQIRSIPNMLFGDAVGFYDHYRVKLCFGRYQRDEQYILDTSVYQNVYLEIPWTLDTTYYTTHTFSYTIRYLRPIQRLAPVGFIRSRDIEYDQHAWTAAGHYFVDLPLKYPWHMLGCRIYDIDEDLVNDIPHIKLDIDDGRLVLVDDDTDDLITVNSERLPYPVHVFHKKAYASGTNSFIRAYLGRPEEITLLPYSGTSFDATLISFDGQQVNFDLWSGASGVSAAGHVNASIWGSAYMCCLIIKDWWKDWFEPDPHAPFPAAEHSEADIDYTHGAFTVTDLRTFLQEICPLNIG